MKKKNGLQWFFTVFVALCAISAFTIGGGILSGLLFLILAFLISPMRKRLIENLPENFQRKGVLVAIGSVVGLLALFTFPSAPNNDETRSTQVDTTSVVNETSRALPTEDRATPGSDEAVKTVEESNTLKLLDEQESEETAKKAEEEAAKKKAEEEAAKKKAEEEAAKKAEEEAAKKKAEAKKAEEEAAKKKAEEEATKKAEEEAARKKAEEEEVVQKEEEEATRQAEQQPDSSTIANGTESPDALAVLQMGPTTGSPCWVPRNGGTKYHSKSSCSQMIDPIYTTVDTAAACGFEACKRCH